SRVAATGRLSSSAADGHQADEQDSTHHATSYEIADHGIGWLYRVLGDLDLRRFPHRFRLGLLGLLAMPWKRHWFRQLAVGLELAVFLGLGVVDAEGLVGEMERHLASLLVGVPAVIGGVFRGLRNAGRPARAAATAASGTMEPVRGQHSNECSKADH